jgi:hypothetical protein
VVLFVLGTLDRAFKSRPEPLMLAFSSLKSFIFVDIPERVVSIIRAYKRSYMRDAVKESPERI